MILSHNSSSKIGSSIFRRFVAPYEPTHEIFSGKLSILIAANDPAGNQVVLKLPAPEGDRLRGLQPKASADALRYQAEWLNTARRSRVLGVVQLIEDRTSEALPFLALERLQGPTLGETLVSMELEDGEPFDLPECLSFLERTASTLAELHSRDLHHGDVKPDNLMKRGERFVLLDPAPEGFYTPGYVREGVSSREDRDVFALGRTFEELYRRVLEIQDLDSDQATEQLIDQMQGDLGSIPSAAAIAKWAGRQLAQIRRQTK